MRRKTTRPESVASSAEALGFEFEGDLWHI